MFSWICFFQTVSTFCVDRKLDFWEWSISFLCLSCPPPRRPQRLCCPIFFIFMVSLEMWCQIGGRSSSHSSWRLFSFFLNTTVSLSAGYHPQSNGQNEPLNQELETCLCFLFFLNPATWSKHHIWVEYALNTLPGSASGLSPFQCAYGYQSLLLPDMETEVSIHQS